MEKTVLYELRKKARNEKRRLKLIDLIEKKCGGVNANLARKLKKEPSYINRVLYPEGKEGKKNIGEDLMDAVIDAFEFPEDWWLDDDLRGIRRSDFSESKLKLVENIRIMPEEDFQSQERVFTAVVENAKKGNDKEE
ncbi:MAG: hypothetical protein H0X02_09850 [Nitrosomonas sp.]|nr:hypothetical protein [Nitrosomonas sp.]